MAPRRLVARLGGSTARKAKPVPVPVPAPALVSAPEPELGPDPEPEPELEMVLVPAPVPALPLRLAQPALPLAMGLLTRMPSQARLWPAPPRAGLRADTGRQVLLPCQRRRAARLAACPPCTRSTPDTSSAAILSPATACARARRKSSEKPPGCELGVVRTDGAGNSQSARGLHTLRSPSV